MTKEQQIKEIARDLPFLTLERDVHISSTNVEKRAWTLSEEDNKIIAEALYNAGYRKVSDSEVELQELNIKYYNEAKDLRRQLADTKVEKRIAELENKRLNKAINNVQKGFDNGEFISKDCKISALKQFAEKLKKKVHNYYPSIDSYCTSRHVILVKDIDELLKEYANEI